MSFSDIQGTPVQISLFFVNLDSAPPPWPPSPSPHPLGGAAAESNQEKLLAQLPQSAQDALNLLLSRPLDRFFDLAWLLLQGTAQSTVQQAIQKAQPNAYNVNASFPSKGTLRAQVGNSLSIDLLGTLPPGTNGKQLTLSYLLPGVSVTFSESTDGVWGSWADPSYKLTFDAEIEIDVAVPDNTFTPLGAKAEFLTHNMQAGPGNFFAGLIVIEDAISAWLNDQPLSSGSSLQDQIVPINNPALQQLFGGLSSGFATTVDFGFLQLGVQIITNPPSGTPPWNTVEFDLTHHFDPGPVVTNSLGLSLFHPQIGTSVPSVNAGGQLGVTGSYFPAAQSSQLMITWTDTTSGNVAQSEVQWGLVPTCQAPPPPQPTDVKITRHPYDNANTFTAKGLTPNTSYDFRVRDFDVTNVIATDWSAWTCLTTTATDQVQLVLDDGNNTVIGFATLQTDGAFLTTVIVPSSEPPGTYNLWAVLSGQQMASTPITVVASGQALLPVLQILDPNTGIPFMGTSVIFVASPVKIRGSDFSPGAVNLFVDSTGGQSLGQAAADQIGSFTVTVTWPFGITGSHNILAQQNALQATAAVYAGYPPQ